MTEQHPITPPPELVDKLRNDAPRDIRDAGVTRERHLVIAAYRAGADQELEACMEWMWSQFHDMTQWADELHAARRPKPPSLAAKALIEFKSHQCAMETNGCDTDLLRAALERLQELENNG